MRKMRSVLCFSVIGISLVFAALGFSSCVTASGPSFAINEPFSSQSEDSDKVFLPAWLELPVCGAAFSKKDHEIRHYAYYSICYRESYEQAEWSAYCLTEDFLTHNVSRSNDFRSDPEISTGSAFPSDYKKSGYDRGHLAPAGDFAFDSIAMSETFFMSNMSPQTPELNRGIWLTLEKYVREWVKKFRRVYVVSGPILEKNPKSYKKIGQSGVSVPEFYYKALLFPLYADEEDRASPNDAAGVLAVGFIFPNAACEGTIFDYAVTIEELERRTGLDFFSRLADSIERPAEKVLLLAPLMI